MVMKGTTKSKKGAFCDFPTGLKEKSQEAN